MMGTGTSLAGNTALSAESWVIGSLSELDALVGQRVLHAPPQVCWEDSVAHLRYESLDDALDAMRDPFLQAMIPDEKRQDTTLNEVQEFEPYSAKLPAAWKLVEHLTPEILHVRREGGEWHVAFGHRPEVAAPCVPQAICLAALRAVGVEVQLRKA